MFERYHILTIVIQSYVNLKLIEQTFELIETAHLEIIGHLVEQRNYGYFLLES